MSKVKGLFAFDIVNNKLLQCDKEYCNDTAFFTFDNGKALCVRHGSRVGVYLFVGKIWAGVAPRKLFQTQREESYLV